MNMICHQYIGMDRTTALLSIFFKPFKIESVICSCEKAGLTVITTLNDM